METTKYNDLGYLGREAQFKIARALFEDGRTFNEIYAVLDCNYFSEAPLRKIIGMFLESYKKKGTVPSYTTIEVNLKATVKQQMELEEDLEYLETIKKTSLNDIDDIKRLVYKFCQQQQLTAVTNRIMDDIKKGNDFKRAIPKRIAELQNIIEYEENVRVTNPFESLSITLDSEQEERIPVKIDKLDKILNGGLGKGAFAALQANTGCGKTTLSSIFAANVALSGKKVVLFYFEDRIEDIHRKFYAHITGRNANEFINPTQEEKREIIEEITSVDNYQNLKNNIKLVKLKTGEYTVEDLTVEYRKLLNNDFAPDMVIIDYFDCLKFSANPIKDRLEAEERCMRKLENFASDNNVALWLMLQGNRKGATSTGDDTIQGSYRKKQIAHIWIEVSRTPEQQCANEANVKIAKNRQGGVGVFENVYLNNGCCQFSIDEVIRNDVDLIYKEENNKF